jgi:Ice-binding-like
LSGIAEPAASAAQPPVGLGAAAAYAVLAGSTVTNTGPSVISGDLGLYSGTAVMGFPPGKVINGTEQIADAEALQAQSALKTAYNDAAGRGPATSVTKDLGGQTLAPGVYAAAKGIDLTGTVTLDAEGDNGAVFIFQAGSTLLGASSSRVKLIDGAQACNVFWQVGSSATLGTDDTFVGTILALTSATLFTGATVDGRVLARNGEVTLDDNTISLPTCATTGTTTTTTTAASSTTTTTAASSTTTTTLAGTTVPVPPTGEPWAGWPYWALASLAGILGVASLERAVQIRRRRS